MTYSTPYLCLRSALVNPTVVIRRPVADLARMLADRGHTVTIFSPGGRGKQILDKYHYHDKLRHKHIKLELYKSVDLPGVSFEWPIPFEKGFLKRVRKILRTHDAVQMWAYFYLVSVAFAFVKRKAKLIITLDTMPAVTFKTSFFMDFCFRIYNATLGKWILRSADIRTLYSKSIPLKDSLVLPTGVTPSSEKSKGDFRKKFPGRKIITFIGLLNERKGVDIVCRVARKVDAEFLIIGEGPRKEEYESMSGKNVHVLGRRNDIHSILEQTDIFFFPSRGEGLPGVVFEAMLHGVPVVASNIPCIDEQIVQGKGGVLVTMEDEKRFVRELKKLLADDARRKSMSVYNKKKIKEFYWEKLLPRYEELYVRNSRT